MDQRLIIKKLLNFHSLKNLKRAMKTKKMKKTIAILLISFYFKVKILKIPS